MHFTEIQPAELTLTCHFDGACQPNPGKGGCGIVINGVPCQRKFMGGMPLGELKTSNSAE